MQQSHLYVHMRVLVVELQNVDHQVERATQATMTLVHYEVARLRQRSSSVFKRRLHNNKLYWTPTGLTLSTSGQKTRLDATGMC
jgi:hypothetical protein